MAEEFKEYHGKRVRIVLDGRGVNVSSWGLFWGYKLQVSLDLTARLVGEADNYIDLEGVQVKNSGILSSTKDDIHYTKGEFPRARVNKEYLIGVFEERGK